MQVVATAGHVDHGKSTLVQALTGMQPDRLAEEQRRGLSIELGYAWTDFDDVGEVAFVDVPGHERFLGTALAGVGPVQVVLFVVAADDPWMPQAAEHLRVLTLLGVDSAVVAVTRSDLADPGPAIDGARAHLATSSLAHAPIVAVSARTGLGMAELREALTRVLQATPDADQEADVRLWVDRRFHVPGAGVVVTGTLPAGTISLGETLADIDGRPVRVRGLEALGRRREAVSGPARVAVNVSGPAAETLRRGAALLTPASYLATTAVDVEIDGPERVPPSIQFHIGSVKVEAKVRPLALPFARVLLADELPLRVGDRAVLRDPGSRELWGARVVDPLPAPLRRRGAAAARARDVATLDGSLAADLLVRGPIRCTVLHSIGLDGPLPPDSLEVEGWLVPNVAARRDELVALVGAGPGLSLAEATRALGLPDPVITRALVDEPLEYRGGRVQRSDRRLSESAAQALDWLRQRLADQPFAAPTSEELIAAGIDGALAAELRADGCLVMLAPGVLLLPDAPDAAIALLATLRQPFTTSEARRMLQTSRRVVLPLLALLDATGRTVRLPDDTRRVTDRP